MTRPFGPSFFAQIRAVVQSRRRAPGRRSGGGVDSLRLIVCARAGCRQAFFLCSRCDRGNRYCPGSCAFAARRESLRRAGARYQRSRDGRLSHAASQKRYRERSRLREKVTHHPSTEPLLPGIVAPTTTPAARATVAPRATGAGEVTAHAGQPAHPSGPRCARCGRPGTFVRHEFLFVYRRRLRPPRLWRGEVTR